MQIIVDILVYSVSNLSRDQKEVTGLISACSGSRVSRGHGLHETGTFWYPPSVYMVRLTCEFGFVQQHLCYT